MHRKSIVYMALLLLAPFSFVNSRAATLQSNDSADTPAVEQRVDKLVQQMTLDEKLQMIGGTRGFFTQAVPRLGIPELKMSDGPMGVRTWGPTTAYPAGIGLAATWDKTLAQEMGKHLGRDARARGVNFLLAPGVDIYRSPMNGRNFEYFGEDPYLSGQIAVGYIDGVQSKGVIATVKHFAANDSEYDRHNTNSIVDERTLHEIDLPAFRVAVEQGHVGAIMDSYNLVNGEHSTQNKELNIDIARKQWHFDGIIMSDWDATYDGVAAANGGLDLEMPYAKLMTADTLKAALQSGKVTEATIDEKVRNILRKAIEFHFLDRPQIEPSIPLESADNHAFTLKAAEESLTLLKNEGNVLPLNRQQTKTIAVIGPDAWPAVPGAGGSSEATAFHAVSFLEGLTQVAGRNTKVLYDRGLLSNESIINDTHWTTAAQNGKSGITEEVFTNAEFSGEPAVSRVVRVVRWHKEDESVVSDPALGKAKNLSLRWSGYYTPAKSGAIRFYIQQQGSGNYRLLVDGKVVLEHNFIEGATPLYAETNMRAGRAYHVQMEFHYKRAEWGGNSISMGATPAVDALTPTLPAILKQADAVVVCVGFATDSESEGSDRTFELPGGQDDLIRAAAAASKKVIVVVTAGGNVDMTHWLHDVPALVYAWYPGEEGGTALAHVVFGDVDPSGKLPASFERVWTDNPTHNNYYPNDPASGPTAVRYNDGLFYGYRYYDRAQVKPQFPFGFGLSYTSFRFSNLSVEPKSPAKGEPVTVSFDVTNSGKMAGADVAQLYLGDPSAPVERPIKELKGFDRVELAAGATKHVSLKLNEHDMSYWDVKAHAWTAAPGKFTVYVGDSSQNVPLTADFNLK
ncbi:MAG: beta-glucosidase [Acidobacteriaceae bacterium]